METLIIGGIVVLGVLFLSTGLSPLQLWRMANKKEKPGLKEEFNDLLN
jgi:hypothetical protein